MRVVILNPGLRLLFFCKSSHFQGSDGMHAPFFFEKTIPRDVQEKLFIFPLAAPPGKMAPPEHSQIPVFFAFFKHGVFLGKRSNARGKVLKMSEIT